MNILLSMRSTTDQSIREVHCALDDELVIGRGAEQGVLLDGEGLSREHVLLGTDGTNFYLTDLSSNGTRINGTKLARSVKTRVRPEDSIEVPGYLLHFRIDLPETSRQSNRAMPARAATGAPGMLDPMFRFIGSFSFTEKLLILVGATGLLFFFLYLTS